jgi:hypothetical protein
MMRRAAVVLVVSLLMLAPYGCSSPDAGGGADAPGDVQAGTATYPAGVYTVGVDLTAGEYRLTADGTSGGYLKVQDADSGLLVIAQGFINRYYFTAVDGQVLETRGAGLTPIAEAVFGESSSLGEGMHLVGRDCPAGEYALSQMDGYSGSYCIYDSSAADQRLIEFGKAESTDGVTVEEGQYIFLSGCTAKRR